MSNEKDNKPIIRVGDRSWPSDKSWDAITSEASEATGVDDVNLRLSFAFIVVNYYFMGQRVTLSLVQLQDSSENPRPAGKVYFESIGFGTIIAKHNQAKGNDSQQNFYAWWDQMAAEMNDAHPGIAYLLENQLNSL